MALILVVDDDPLWIEVHSRVLRIAGHEVRAVSSAVEALEEALERFDLIVTDFDMPVLTGADLAREVHLRLRRSAPPLVLVSALCEACPDWREIFAAGHQKPYRSKALLADVERLLRSRPSRPHRSGVTLCAVRPELDERRELDEMGEP